MATLLDVPNEVLHEILSCLKGKYLAAVSGVSRRFHTLSLPLLYKAPVVRAWGGFRPPTLPWFLRTLMAVPSLATHIQSLTLELERFPPLYGTGSSEFMTRDPGSEDLRPTQDLQPTQGLQLEQLLCMVPRLTYLELWPLEYPDSYGCGFMRFSELLHDPMTLPLGLQNLREFHSVGGIGVTCLLLVAVMALPSIRIIAVTVNHNAQFNSDQHDSLLTAAIAAAINSSSVTDLCLLESHIPYPLLTGILSVPRALTRFEFISLLMEMHFDFAGFRASLEPLIPTLRHLSIGCAMTELPEVNVRSRTVDTLRSWPALKTLRLPMIALLGRFPSDHPRLVDMLPRSLRSLCVMSDVYWSTESVVETLVTLLEPGQMGSLQEMKLVLVPGTGIDFRRLREACEEVEVAFVVEWEPRWT